MRKVIPGSHPTLRPTSMAMVLVTPCQLEVCTQEIALGLHLSLCIRASPFPEALDHGNGAANLRFACNRLMQGLTFP